MKAKYKEKARLILIDNKLSKKEKIAAMDKLWDEYGEEFLQKHSPGIDEALSGMLARGLTG